ncbi:MAG: CBS domain-containing protein [Armatimonadetes bacterium]|nr:CBS domain-containing protein [Armatimonadota bacterium]
MPDRVAREIMVPVSKYAAVNENDSLKHAIQVLKDSLPSGFRTLIVLDDEGNLAGFLTTRTLLKALGVYGVEEDIWTTDNWGTFFMRIEKERLKKVKVKKIMRPVVKVFVNEDTPVQEVAHVILTSQINHIPVLDKEKKAVGIIRTIDILDVLAGFLED